MSRPSSNVDDALAFWVPVSSVADGIGVTIKPMAAVYALQNAPEQWRCVRISDGQVVRRNYLYALAPEKLSHAAAIVRDELRRRANERGLSENVSVDIDLDRARCGDFLVQDAVRIDEIHAFLARRVPKSPAHLTRRRREPRRHDPTHYRQTAKKLTLVSHGPRSQESHSCCIETCGSSDNCDGFALKRVRRCAVLPAFTKFVNVLLVWLPVQNAISGVVIVAAIAVNDALISDT
ncbi:type 2 periplasmic-binding domain-containing protein [Caballeronia grimmiae]|uniref:hypothetical protein n=1 Tax=Caballeronia grimmiae TaxID=1071679 RepID=UPI0038B96BF4